MPTLDLRDGVAALARLAERDLAVLWRRVETADQARDMLKDVLPSLVEAYGQSAATVAADWYDDLREEAGVRGRFRALVPDVGQSGAESLATWGVDPLYQKTPDWESAKTLIAGGLQRRIANASRETVTGSSVADPGASGWQRTGVGECDWCNVLIGRGAVYTKATVDFAAHDHCFPAGVLVTGPSVEIGFRRWYEGELVIIRMAGGKELPVTPNHPILTSRGWIAAGSLCEGDDVIQRSGADLAALDVPHEHDVPTPIEDLWGAASVNPLRSVPVASEDFHGDAVLGQGDVDVVASDRFFSNMRHIFAAQQLAQTVSTGTGAASVLNPLSTHRDVLLPLIRSDHFSDRLVSVLGESGALCTRHASQSGSLGFGRGLDRDVCVAEPAGDYAAVHSVMLGHRQDAFARLVLGSEVVRGIEPVPGGAAPVEVDTPPMQSLPYPVARFSAGGDGNLVKRLAGGVETLRVVELSRRDFAGHVYNLQTAEGWYAADGVIVSNCRCGAVPAWGGKPLPVQPYKVGPRHGSQADYDRAKKWIADNQ